MSSEQERAAAPADPTSDRWNAAQLLAGFATLYALTQQHGYYGDGRGLLARVEAGAWASHNLLYLPAAQLLRALLGPFHGSDPELALRVLSAGSSAGAVALLFLAARRLGIAVNTALSACLLVGLSPLAWFYATCVEVHGLHLLAAALGVWWLAGSRARGQLGSDALPLALILLLLGFTHMSGVLWAPAVAWLALRSQGRWRLPRRWWSAPVLLALGAALWWMVVPTSRDGTNSGRSFIGMALEGLTSRRSLASLQRELVLPLSFLLPFVITGALRSWLERRTTEFAPLEPGPGSLVGATLVLAATYVIVVSGLPLEEHGAYYAGLLPWLGLLAANRLVHARRPASALLSIALVALQAGQGWKEARSFDLGYTGRAWIEPLEKELGGRGCVLALDHWEWVAIGGHTRLDAISLHLNRIQVDAGSAEALAGATSFIEKALARGEGVALTRSLVESAEARPLLDKLVSRYGQPRSGAHPEYLILLSPARR